MSQTLAARVLQRRQRTAGRRSPLNLVALMDVFTILVFFFLAHSSDAAYNDIHERVRLPESMADQKPRQTLIVTVTTERIVVAGKVVANVGSTLKSTASEIAGLRSALLARGLPKGNGAGDEVAEIVISGDKSVPFRVIKKVMQTCTRAGYGRISLAVLQGSPQPG